MDDTGFQKLRIKVGEHEFDAEGPADAVQAQFEQWSRLVAQAPAPAPAAPAVDVAPIKSAHDNSANGKRDRESVDGELSTIMRVDGRVVSFTVPPATPQEAVLLLLFGQKVLRQNDSVTGYEVIAGLQNTGGLAASRPDRLLVTLAKAGDVIVIGEARGKRYRLTNTGLAKARQLAFDLIAKVA